MIKVADKQAERTQNPPKKQIVCRLGRLLQRLASASLTRGDQKGEEFQHATLALHHVI